MNGKNGNGEYPGVWAALLAAMQYGHAASQPTPPASKIGMVSVRDVFNGSKRHAQYQAQSAKRLSQARAQMDDMTKEIETEEAELKALKQGTADYVKQFQDVLETRSKLQNQQELLKQQRMPEDKKWIEALYQETLKAPRRSRRKGLDLVLERTEPKFPVASEEVWSTFSTHKVLYGGGCVDLTQEVIARVDASATSETVDRCCRSHEEPLRDEMNDD